MCKLQCTSHLSFTIMICPKVAMVLLLLLVVAAGVAVISDAYLVANDGFTVVTTSSQL